MRLISICSLFFVVFVGHYAHHHGLLRSWISPEGKPKDLFPNFSLPYFQSQCVHLIAFEVCEHLCIWFLNFLTCVSFLFIIIQLVFDQCYILSLVSCQEAFNCNSEFYFLLYVSLWHFRNFFKTTHEIEWRKPCLWQCTLHACAGKRP